MRGRDSDQPATHSCSSGTYLLAGNQDGAVHAYDLRTLAPASEPVRNHAQLAPSRQVAQEPALPFVSGARTSFAAHADSVNGIRCNVCGSTNITSIPPQPASVAADCGDQLRAAAL